MTKFLSLFDGWNTYIREYGNGISFALCLVLVYVLAGFLFRTYNSMGGFNAFRKSDGASAACVLWWLLIAEGLRAVCAYLPLDAYNAGEKLSPTVTNIVSFGFALAVVIIVAVLARAVFLFQKRNLIAATFIAAALTTATVLWWRELFGIMKGLSHAI